MVASRLALIAAATTSLAGCDLVFGLSGDSAPCEVASFAAATPEDIAEAEDFSFDWDDTFAVIQNVGAMYELESRTKTITPIELGPYNNYGLSLTPEGDALFYTIGIEPPELKGALRGGAAEWRLDAGTPRGTFAGTPSADVFGPRRVMVKMRGGDTAVQEYEDVSGVWTTVGMPRAMSATAQRAPNLTPNGLTMVYPGFSEVGEPAVYVAQRASMTAAFGEPMAILDGNFVNAQLVGECSRLYVSDGTILRRYDP